MFTFTKTIKIFSWQLLESREKNRKRSYLTLEAWHSATDHRSPSNACSGDLPSEGTGDELQPFIAPALNGAYHRRRCHCPYLFQKYYCLPRMEIGL
jgi:hypothetical protein